MTCRLQSHQPLPLINYTRWLANGPLSTNSTSAQLRADLIAATNEIDRDGDAEFVDVLRDTHRLLTTRLGLQMVILVEPGEEESR